MSNTFDVLNLTVTVMSDGTCTVAQLKDALSGEILSAGSAKRHPTDSHDERVGFNLAVARALRQWADVSEAAVTEYTTK